MRQVPETRLISKTMSHDSKDETLGVHRGLTWGPHWNSWEPFVQSSTKSNSALERTWAFRGSALRMSRNAPRSSSPGGLQNVQAPGDFGAI